MRFVFSVICCLFFIGFFPISCCKNQSTVNGKIDIIRFKAVNYLTSLTSYDTLLTQFNADTIKQSDSLYLIVQLEIRLTAFNNSHFSFFNNAYAAKCQSGNSSTYELQNKITSIELESDTTYNGHPKATNLLPLIVEDGSLWKDKLNNSKEYISNISLKINEKPIDVFKHQFTLRIKKENGDVIEGKFKRLYWN